MNNSFRPFERNFIGCSSLNCRIFWSLHLISKTRGSSFYLKPFDFSHISILIWHLASNLALSLRKYSGCFFISESRPKSDTLAFYLLLLTENAKSSCVVILSWVSLRLSASSSHSWATRRLLCPTWASVKHDLQIGVSQVTQKSRCFLPGWNPHMLFLLTVIFLNRSGLATYASLGRGWRQTGHKGSW